MPPASVPAASSYRDRALVQRRRLVVLSAVLLAVDALVLARRVRDYRTARTARRGSAS